MKAIECVIWCDCEQGQMFKTSLDSRDGRPAMFWLTEDEHLFLQGYCSHCGNKIEYKVSLMQLLFSCPKERTTQ